MNFLFFVSPNSYLVSREENRSQNTEFRNQNEKKKTIKLYLKLTTILKEGSANIDRNRQKIR